VIFRQRDCESTVMDRITWFAHIEKRIRRLVVVARSKKDAGTRAVAENRIVCSYPYEAVWQDGGKFPDKIDRASGIFDEDDHSEIVKVPVLRHLVRSQIIVSAKLLDKRRVLVAAVVALPRRFDLKKKPMLRSFAAGVEREEGVRIEAATPKVHLPPKQLNAKLADSTLQRKVKLGDRNVVVQRMRGALAIAVID